MYEEDEDDQSLLDSIDKSQGLSKFKMVSSRSGKKTQKSPKSSYIIRYKVGPSRKVNSSVFSRI